MADSGGSWVPGILQSVIGGALLELALFVGASMLVWLKSKGQRWARLLLDTVVGWACLHILFYGLKSEAFLSLHWWSYLISVGFLVFFLFLNWREGGHVVRLWMRFQKTTPAIVFVVEKTWINSRIAEDVPLKLWMLWSNQGIGIHIGKPRWEVKEINTQGYRLGMPLAYRFRYRHGEGDIETEEVDVEPGKRGEIWIGLDQKVSREQVEHWKDAQQLGILVLPVTAGKVTKEVRIEL